jgi:hypothetical protein
MYIYIYIYNMYVTYTYVYIRPLWSKLSSGWAHIDEQLGKRSTRGSIMPCGAWATWLEANSFHIRVTSCARSSNTPCARRMLPNAWRSAALSNDHVLSLSSLCQYFATGNRISLNDPNSKVLGEESQPCMMPRNLLFSGSVRTNSLTNRDECVW